MWSKRFQVLIAVFLLGFFAACAPLNGNVHLLQVDKDNFLYGPWKDSDSNNIIGKQSSPSITNDDAFTLYFDQAFFKYMPDLFGENEIVLIFTFDEGASESDDKKVVKIIGPMDRTGDESYGSSIGRVTYGPKRVEGDVISVHVQVVEFDGKEADDQSAFLDFLGGASEAFSLADPVTTAEISLAKEIAKALIQSNESDIILDFKFDLLPKDVTALNFSANDGHRPISLRPGNWAIIKQEKCALLRCYFPAWDNVGELTVWTFIPKVIAGAFDLVVTSPIVTLVKIFSDTPKSESVASLEVQQRESTWGSVQPATQKKKEQVTPLKVTDFTNLKAEKNRSLELDTKRPRLTVTLSSGNASTIAFMSFPPKGSYLDGEKAIWFEPNSRKLFLKTSSNFDPYEAKTWMTFSIEQGRDPSNWEKRKVLSPAEQDLLAKIKKSSSLSFENIDETLQKLEKAKKEIKKIETRGHFALLFPRTTITKAEFNEKHFVLIQHADELLQENMRVRLHDEAGKPVFDSAFKWPFEAKADSQSTGTNVRFQLANTNLGTGKYQILLDYEQPDDAKMSTVRFPFEITD